MGSERKRFLKALMAAALSGAMAMGPCAGGVALADEAIGAQAEIPARYDQREQGVVTPVKYQNPFGTCWAFGGIAAAETSILSDSGTTFAQTPLDLSEKHLAWFALQPVTEAENKEQAGEGIHVEVEGDMTQTSAVYNFGGYPIYVTSLFSSGTGPMLEETFPYQGNEAILERDYCLSHFDELFETSVKAYAELHPELDDATIRDLADKEL